MFGYNWLGTIDRVQKALSRQAPTKVCKWVPVGKGLLFAGLVRREGGFRAVGFCMVVALAAAAAPSA